MRRKDKKNVLNSVKKMKITIGRRRIQNRIIVKRRGEGFRKEFGRRNLGGLE